MWNPRAESLRTAAERCGVVRHDAARAYTRRRALVKAALYYVCRPTCHVTLASEFQLYDIDI